MNQIDCIAFLPQFAGPPRSLRQGMLECTDEAEAGSRGGIMKLSDGGRSGREDAVGGGSVTRSFLLTVEAGWGERRIRLDSGLSLHGCQSVHTADGERPMVLEGPVVIDPEFSSVWAALIIFPPLLSAQNIGDIV